MKDINIVALRRAARANDYLALFQIGIYDFNSEKIEDANLSFDKFFQLADLSIDQLDELVESHHHLVTQLVDLGSDDVFFKIGYYFNTEQIDLNRAKFWFQLAVALGNSTAAFNLGAIFSNSDNFALAKRFYSTSQQLGDVDAYFFHAEILLNEGVREIAIDLLKEGVSKGCVRSLCRLGQLAQIDGDLKSSVQWFKRGAMQGDPDSIVELGLILAHRGKFSDSEKMFLRAADLQSVWAMASLGWLFSQSGDQMKSRGWFLRAAESGDSDSMVELGSMSLEEGNVEAASRWFQQAFELGNDRAILRLQSINNQ